MEIKILGTILILALFVLTFGFLAQIETTEAQIGCSYASCEQANAGLICLCGNTLTSPLKPWCCASVNGVYASRPECQTACMGVGVGVGPGVGTVPKAPTLDIMTVLDRIVDWLFAILLVIAAIFIIVAGYYFVTAAGSPEQVSKARAFVLYALIGVLVAFAAKGLINLVGRIVGA
jgi:hypothetical protein